ncbi:hypothetical protein Rleg_5970 (plasmid) [Rhizobium leguminosarum bv. trifolii WSM1325]|uniref:Uncharacterized protein n=1 Tax=Rhizobium leguminosarum bv. trifolii (strain WSM1325) TaxID=395491 RepID=C6B8J9_RHILS|nr:hypothetical protein Rleg_5970 [Rhizobium leguminosarum bv. trifolii WSM1325]
MVAVGHTREPFARFARDVVRFFAVRFDCIRPAVFPHQALNHGDVVRPEGRRPYPNALNMTLSVLWHTRDPSPHPTCLKMRG